MASLEIQHHELGPITLQLVDGHENIQVLEQSDGQHILFTVCYVCEEHELLSETFPVTGRLNCCIHCFNGLVNAYGATMYGNRHERAHEYEQWQNEINPPSVTGTMRKQVFARDGHACRYCGAAEALTIDHLIPQSRGGLHAITNLVTACFPCNTRKGARTLEAAGMTLRPAPGAQ